MVTFQCCHCQQKACRESSEQPQAFRFTPDWSLEYLIQVITIADLRRYKDLKETSRMSEGASIFMEPRIDNKRWWALIGASLAVFMAALDGNVVNVALPIMAQMFHVTRDIRWVSLSYILPTTAFLGIFGALSDLVGRKRVILAGVLLFIAGSVLCGTAGSLGQMILYRVIQGIGGSCIGSAIIAIATVNFAPKERGRSMAVIGLIAPLGAVVGPGVGGLLIGALGWPAIFFINVPFGIISFLLIARLLPKDQPGQGHGFDVPGAVLFSAALFLLLLGLAPGANGLSMLDYVLLAGSAAAVLGFLAVERKARFPLVPLSLLRRSRFSIPLAGILTSSIVGIGLGFIMPFFLEETLRFDPEHAGLTLLFFPLAMALASQAAGRLTDRFNPILPASIGAATCLFGLLMLLPLDSHWRMADVALRFAIGGFGTGLFLSPSSVAVMAAAPPEHIGVGGALTNTARYLGFALGPTLATIFWNPGLHGAASVSAMRVVLFILAAIQAATLATVLSYRVERKDVSTRPRIESAL
jgi:EmrB/QacA subfamily drug resistance transporter